MECSFKQKVSRGWNQFVCLNLDYVPWWKASHRRGNQISLDTFGVCETGFLWGGLCPRGLPGMGKICLKISLEIYRSHIINLSRCAIARILFDQTCNLFLQDKHDRDAGTVRLFGLPNNSSWPLDWPVTVIELAKHFTYSKHILQYLLPINLCTSRGCKVH